MLTKAEVQRLRSLREKKHREQLGLFVVEGEKVIAELLAAKVPFEALYATADWAGSAHCPPGLNPTRISGADMERISHFPTPSAVLAVGRLVRTALRPDELAHGLTLALDGVQDAGNVGTLLRIADWFGFARVVLSPDCADVFHQKVINASMGSFARVRTHVAALSELLQALNPDRPGSSPARPGGSSVRVPVIGCDLAGDDVQTLPAFSAAVVVIGSEGRGLSPAVDQTLTQRVTIPRFGLAESLNAAVAAGIVCHQLRRGASRAP